MTDAPSPADVAALAGALADALTGADESEQAPAAPLTLDQLYHAALVITLPLVEPEEGLSLTVYRDIAGYPTIGRGSRYLLDGSPVTMETAPINLEYADELFARQMIAVFSEIQGGVRVRLMPWQLAACGSLAFNIGIGRFNGSLVRQCLNRGLLSAAADAFRSWKYAAGKVCPPLVKRRELERSTFLGVHT